jgi:hypothetical protein
MMNTGGESHRWVKLKKEVQRTSMRRATAAWDVQRDGGRDHWGLEDDQRMLGVVEEELGDGKGERD